MEKILGQLTDMIENVVVVCAIEESKDLVELAVDELIDLLLALEQRKKAQEEKISRGGHTSQGSSPRCHGGLT
jgi:hypothetical protein